MTRHSLHDIASIVSRAGFTGDAIAEAVALAMHNSNGDDTYDNLYCVDPLIHFRGLFGQSVATVGADDAHKLFDPHYCAQQLYQHFRENQYRWTDGIDQLNARVPVNVAEIRAAISSRTPTTPIDHPSKIAQVAYSQRL